MATSRIERLVNYASLARDAARVKTSNSPDVRNRARNHLIATMGKLHGLPQKIGQMMSFSLNDDGADDNYASLQDRADPLPLDVAKSIVEAAWRQPLSNVLTEFSEAKFCASLGQVHQAVTKCGRTVAIKVQYPGIREAIRTDLGMMGWLSVPGRLMNGNIDIKAYQQTILQDLKQELDYRIEAQQQTEFAEHMTSSRTMIVPEVVHDLSTNNVLVTSWEEGEHWNSVRRTWSPKQKRALAVQLLQLFLDGLFRHRKLQADWHPGNFRFRRHGDKVQVVLYDFGCIVEPSVDEQLALARLIQTVVNPQESPWPLMMKLGFNRELLEPIADRLPALCRVLFEPFASDFPYDMNDWKLAERVADILGPDRWNFRLAGPSNLIFLVRAFHGLAFYLQGLGTPVFWRRAFDEVRAELHDQLSNLQLSKESPSHCRFPAMAQYLKVRISENGRTKVQMTQRATTVERLDELLDDSIKQRIDEQHINLPRIVADVRRRGYAPASLFTLSNGAKQIDVWLE